jgi:hypothetical protein
VFLQKHCLENDECIKAELEYKKAKQKKQEAKDWSVRKNQLKEKLKTHKDYVQELQKVFNSYIRRRDADKPCISCGTKLDTKFDAGHYRSAGGNPELRFDESNVQGQCVYCNQHLHGNLIEYRKGLINRIGIKEVERLEGAQEPKKYTIPQLIELKIKYKTKQNKTK